MGKTIRSSKTSTPRQDVPEALELQPVRQIYSVQILLTIVAAVVMVMLAWGKVRAVGDFYVALSAGRDMIETNFASLVRPDTWSFMTEGKMWFNQNWGTHLIYYLTYINGGGTGIVVMKALFLFITATAAMMGTKQRGVDWPLAILAGGLAVGAAQKFIDIRPNLMSLMISPVLVWFLLRTRANVHRSWFAMILIALWSAVHGGFIFGIAVMGLWTVCWFICHYFATFDARAVLRKYWPLPAALVGAILLSMVSPFFFKNLTHGFLIGSSEEWRRVTEWVPIYQLAALQHTWEFYVTTGLFLSLPVLYLAIHLLFYRTRRLPLTVTHIVQTIVSVCICLTLLALAFGEWKLSNEPEYDTLKLQRRIVIGVSAGLSLSGLVLAWATMAMAAAGKFRLVKVRAAEVSLAIFDIVLSLVVIAMAIKARRFVPLAAILLMPVVVSQAKWIFRAMGAGLDWIGTRATSGTVKSLFCGIVPALPLVTLACVLLLASVTPVRNLFKWYSPNNPMIVGDSIFKRMVGWRQFPPGAAEFAKTNGLKGRMFNEWRWEGFLRYYCPDLKPYIGGRAQQVYDLDHFLYYNGSIVSAANPRPLSKLGIHLMIVPQDNKHAKMVDVMVNGPNAKWAYVFRDNQSVVLADSLDDETRELIRRARTGELEYASEGIAAMSRMMCLQSPVVGASDAEKSQAVVHAIKAAPHFAAFSILRVMYRDGKLNPAGLEAFLLSVSADMDKMPETGPGAIDLLVCRSMAAEMLGHIYRRKGDKQQADEWKGKFVEFNAMAKRLADKWNR